MARFTFRYSRKIRPRHITLAWEARSWHVYLNIGKQYDFLRYVLDWIGFNIHAQEEAGTHEIYTPFLYLQVGI
jgi:hypothetical protein